MDRCPECGFVYGDQGTELVVAAIRQLGPGYRQRLQPPEPGAPGDGLLARRPRPEVWSALEYACHVRDVLLAQRERLYLALVEECPSFAPIYRDQRAVLARYATEVPARVADDIDMAVALLCRGFDALDAAQWSRTCIYNFPTPGERTLEWFAQHTLHEGEHHLMDIDRVTTQVAEPEVDAPHRG